MQKAVHRHMRRRLACVWPGSVTTSRPMLTNAPVSSRPDVNGPISESAFLRPLEGRISPDMLLKPR